jgi:hypothetical protein
MFLILALNFKYNNNNGPQSRDQCGQHYIETVVRKKLESPQTSEPIRRINKRTLSQVQRNLYATTNIFITLSSSENMW